MLDAVLDLDHDGLVHLVAHHVALTGLAVVALEGGLAHGVGSFLLVVAHAWPPFAGAAPMPSSRSRISV